MTPQPSLASYLESLDHELSRRLAKDDVRARLAEIEAHLRDSIDGRIELGLTAAAAEREAIEAFGKANGVASAIAQSANARWIAVRLQLLAGAYATVLTHYWVVLLLHRLGMLKEGGRYWGAILLLLFAGTLAGTAWIAFRARRVASFPLLATGIAASLILWLFFGFYWLNLWNYGGMGFEARLAVQRSARPSGPVAVDPEHDQARSLALADPLGNWTSQFQVSAGLGMTLAGLFAATDVAFAALGSASRRRRRRGVA